MPSRIRALILADTKAPGDTPEGVEGRKKMLATLDAKGPAAIADEMVPKLLGETTGRERPELTALYEQAFYLLYTAPADLVAAAQAIVQHQATLTRLAANNGERR